MTQDEQISFNSLVQNVSIERHLKSLLPELDQKNSKTFILGIGSIRGFIG